MPAVRVALVNLPWTDPDRPELWGVRAGSRWPHFQRRPEPGALPRYVPFPFFLAAAAAAAKAAGHDVLLLDAVAENMAEPDALGRIGGFAPELLFAETSTPSLANDLRLLRLIRGMLPKTRLACGGAHHAALAQSLMLENGMPDFWLAGEFDLAVAALADALDGKMPLDSVPGLIRPGAEPAAPAFVERLDDLPRPLYNQLPMRNYSDPVCGLPRPGAQVALSRGCPYGCTFCVWPQIVYGSPRYRHREAGAALDEVAFLLAEYGLESFYFDDDTANIGEERMLALAAAIRSRGLDAWPWAMMARADRMTEAMIEAFAKAGMYSVKYGVESVAPALVNACDKATRLDRLYEAVRLTTRAGIKMHMTFTFGIPGETRDTIRQTVAFALESAPETAQFSFCTPFPGTRFYDECRKNGWLVTEDYSRYLGSDQPVVSTPWLSATELRAGYDEACEQWRRFCARRLASRRRRLLERLRAAVAAGARWRLVGEPDFADFLLESGDHALESARIDGSEPDTPGAVPVIVSRHDEEKLWRKLRREQPGAAQQALRLYAQ